MPPLIQGLIDSLPFSVEIFMKYIWATIDWIPQRQAGIGGVPTAYKELLTALFTALFLVQVYWSSSSHVCGRADRPHPMNLLSLRGSIATGNIHDTTAEPLSLFRP